MASELKLISEMVIVLGSATIGGFIANRLRQPVLLGYLISGMIVGPAGLNWIAQEGDIQVLAEVGVALLLFSLGVEFSLKDLLRMRSIAIGGGTIQVISTLLAWEWISLYHRLGGEHPERHFFGGRPLSFLYSTSVKKSDRTQ